jgi:hypothetical protein
MWTDADCGFAASVARLAESGFSETDVIFESAWEASEK